MPTMMMKAAVMATLPVATFASTGSCMSPSGAKGDCYPGREFCGAPFTKAPTYHLMDQHGCGENDPNGPVFDPVHGVIHHFYQIHLAATPGHGPDYGHFVSKDFINWAPLPVAIWNGLDSSVWPPKVTPYDNEAIFTGSALVVDGAGPGGKGKGVVNIYPGLCNKNDWPGCKTGTLLAQAVPANYEHDELLVNWTKPSYNPIIENTQRDPSTPWKTPSGEWRLRTYDSMVYAAKSDADLLAGQWYTVGKSKDLRTCECPSFYPLPAATPGTEAEYEALRRANDLPTHVHKTSCGGDWWQLGSYVAGGPSELGSFNATPGWTDLFKQKKIDQGHFYASKDNEYPTKGSTVMRRVNWGWATVPPQSTQTLPREITFNAPMRTLEQSPLVELEALREAAAFTSGPTTLSPGIALPVSSDIVARSEVLVEFELPAPGTTAGTTYFGVAVGDPAHFAKVATPIAAAADEEAESVEEFDAPSADVVDEAAVREVGVGVDAAADAAAAVSCLVGYQPPSNMSAPYYEFPVTCGPYTDTLRLPTSAKSVKMRVFFDATFLEAYFENGRVAITANAQTAGIDAKLALTSTAPETKIKGATVYPMKSIWTTPEAVRKAPRVYN